MKDESAHISSKTPIVLMPIDTPSRELEWRLMMAVKLAGVGCTSVISTSELIAQSHKCSENCIWLGRFSSNDGTSTRDSLTVAAMQKNKTSMYFIHDEGGFYLDKYYEEALESIHPYDKLVLPNVKAVFFWGELQKKIYCRNHPDISCKSHVYGYPRFDLNKKILRKHKSRASKSILVCTKFSTANYKYNYSLNHAQSPFSSRKLELAKKRVASEAEAFEYVFDFWSHNIYCFEKFLRLIAQLSNEFKEHEIVVRPHPGENYGFYRNFCSHFDNVFLDTNEDAIYSINGSDLVISSSCTTGMEALMADIPLINYIPMHPNFEFSNALLSEIGIVSNSGENVIQLAKSILAQDRTKIELNPNEHLFFNRDLSSSDLILEHIYKDIHNVTMQTSSYIILAKNQLADKDRCFVSINNGKGIKYIETALRYASDEGYCIDITASSDDYLIISPKVT